MPLYFFNVFDDVVTPDEEGIDLPDLEAALTTAIIGARALACDQVSDGRLNLSHRIEIVDETGHAVAVVTYRDAITIEG